jgi:hypothetical protein
MIHGWEKEAEELAQDYARMRKALEEILNITTDDNRPTFQMVSEIENVVNRVLGEAREGGE